MAEILAKKDNKVQCFANLKLDNGERVMISVAQTGVRISKMKWAGMIPAATLWETKSLTEVYEKFFNAHKPTQTPLESIIDKITDCRSCVEIIARLSS